MNKYESSTAKVSDILSLVLFRASWRKKTQDVPFRSFVYGWHVVGSTAAGRAWPAPPDWNVVVVDLRRVARTHRKTTVQALSNLQPVSFRILQCNEVPHFTGRSGTYTSEEKWLGCETNVRGKEHTFGDSSSWMTLKFSWRAPDRILWSWNQPSFWK